MLVTNQLDQVDHLQISDRMKEFVRDCLHKGIAPTDIGLEFEKSKLADNTKKKKHGQFYTPDYIVQYMIDYLFIKRLIKIVDPACGTGSFLLPIISRLGTTDDVYGFDLDKDALEVLTAILYLQNQSITRGNLIHGNTIVSNEKISSHALVLETVGPKEGFDIVISNPPYVTLKKGIDYDAKDPDFKDLLNGQVNAATLMIAKGLKILKENGFLAFVLPKNILHVSSYGKLRKYLLAETTILHIADLRSSFKNVRGEQIILFIQKKKPEKNHRINMKILYNQSFEKASVWVEQRYFCKDNKLYVFETEADYQLINKLTSIPTTLASEVNEEIFRGISVSRSSIVEGDHPYIRGKNIQKFSFQIKTHVDLNAIENNKTSRLLQKKLVAQNIFSSEAGIICAWDDIGVITNETVTNILVEDDRKAHYLLGLLHSKLVNYYLIYGCYNCSKMTMHTDKEYIGSIPVLYPKDAMLFSAISGIVNQLLLEQSNLEKIRLMKQQLDEYFFMIYNLNTDEIQSIKSGLELFLSKKSRW